MQLHELKAPRGANRKRKRVGRGESSGMGKTSGCGHKGQGQRSGKGKPGLGYEGGQMPMFRRMPKRGFHNIFAKQWAEVNLDTLAKHFVEGSKVDIARLREFGLARNTHEGVRVLGRGDLAHALTIVADHVSASAKEKIESAGGKVELILTKPQGPNRAKGIKKGSK